jgi:phage terminase Nu1 subunit (DNA packaging protein)
MVKSTALNKLMSGEKVRAKGWDKEKYIVVNKDGQIVDNEGKTFNMMAAKEKTWELYKEPKSEAALTDNTEVLKLIKELMAEVKELKEAKSSNDVVCDVDSDDIASAVADEVIDAVEDKVTQAIKDNVPQDERNHDDMVKIFYGVSTLKEVRELFKQDLLKCQDKRDVAKTVTKYIPYCWMGSRTIKTVARYYADMRNVIKDVNDQFQYYALELFSVPQDVYERIKKADTKKVLDKLEADKETFDVKEIENTISDLKQKVLKALELGKDATIEQWKEAGLPISKQQTVDRARAYLFATYIAFVTGRRITEILKSLELVKKEDGWYYKGIMKKGHDGVEVKAYSLDDDYELLSKLLKQLREDIDTSNMTNQEVNSKFNHIFNRALKNITGLKYTYHDLREIFAEMAYLKYGKKNGSDREKEDFISDILGHEINKDRLVSANHYMTKEGK